MNKMTNFQDILEFNRAFGVVTHTSPQNDIFTKDSKLVDYRLSLINEEFKEIKDALKNHDFVEMIDGCADLDYVVLGMYTALGVTASGDVEEQFQQFKNSPLRGVFEKHLEALEWLVEYLEKSVSALNSLAKEENFQDVVKTLNDLRVKTYAIFGMLDVNGVQAFKLVHASNMSKLCVSEKEAQETVEWYLANETRYDRPTYRKDDTGSYWVVYNKNTNKILKSINYKKVSFDSLLG